MLAVDSVPLVALNGAEGTLAHLVQTGFGGFYDGMAHSVVTPEDAMVMVALALLSALGGKEQARLLVVAVPLDWFVAGGCALVFPSVLPPPLATTISFGLVGLLVALNQQLPKPVFLVLAILVACLHGAANGGAMRESELGWLGLAGSCVAVFVVVSLLSACLAGIVKPPARVAVRVGGSWLVAIALLMIGWTIRSSERAMTDDASRASGKLLSPRMASLCPLR